MINILVVDDMEMVRSALEIVLKRYPDVGQVFFCTDGDEVLPFIKASNDKIDLIIMDISMKRMDGLSATKQVKEVFPNLPVIILSMHDEETYFTKAQEVNASAFILKNSAGSHIYRVIDEVRSGKRYFERGN